MTVDEFIAKWWGKKGGQERSNFAPFITDLCLTLGLELPGQAEAGTLGSYEYEGSVPGGSFRSLKAGGRIDLYKRGCFVMEAKQSQLPPERQSDLGLFEPAETAPRAPSGARYDRLMADARAQAENYAKSLPGDHPPAPFILVCDVGRAFEIEFDYTGNGRGYGFFPDKQSYRIELPDLADPKIADRLRAIWSDPDSINPRFQSAEVTRRIAERLAAVSKWLEETQRFKTSDLSSFERSLAVEETSLFLMRLLFCMFAEDIELLPKDKFKAFLERSLDSDDYFQTGLEDLWNKMGLPNQPNRFAFAVEEVVRYFNGGLFEANTTYVLGREERGELLTASGYNWRKVEPAIFGTLLEQALSKEERAKLGAHYTPRPYVERLVQATIMDVLEAEWTEASQSPSSEGEGLSAAKSFHDRLAGLRILDPACGTGNFLYVAMEALQTLESRVIERIQQLGGTALARVGPHQFHGLELNPRAAKIAELVLWIGWLRFRIANEPGDIGDPVLASTASINFGRHGGYDAVLKQKETGEPDLDNPMPAEWPEADFIVGNPPFIGGKDIRGRLGDDYAEAMWMANPRVPKSADFVMQWWDRAALLLSSPNTRLRRFGLVTTNSITQEFNRRIIHRYVESDTSAEVVSLAFAIPDHPWTKAGRDSAAVRIAMTVAETGQRTGTFGEVLREANLDSDTPTVELATSVAIIHSNLSVGSDVTSARVLLANKGLASNGMKPLGAGFIVTRKDVQALGLDKREGWEKVIHPYVNGRDLSSRARNVFAIDFFGFDEASARQHFPEAYQHLLNHVRPERLAALTRSSTADAREYAEKWWLFCKPRQEMRRFLQDLQRSIVTVQTAKHRIFQFLPRETMADQKLMVFGLDDGFSLGVLSSTLHVTWTLVTGGWLGVGNDSVYSKSKTFDPFPFPDPTAAQRSEIANLAEELDATRKNALAEVPGLTMTELYNLRDKLRSGAAMTPDGRDRATQADAGIVNRLHEQLDAAVAAAYGWPTDLPSSEILARLVALNAERAAEEKAGQIRWLRPDYQEPRFGKKVVE